MKLDKDFLTPPPICVNFTYTKYFLRFMISDTITLLNRLIDIDPDPFLFR